MQDLLTLTAELIVIVPILFLALDFVSGLMHLYNAKPTTQEDKPETETQTPAARAIVPVQTQSEPDVEQIRVVEDPWDSEGIEVIQSNASHALTPKRIYLLPPALSVVKQPDTVDYSGWTIRALKREAQQRKLSKYSSLTKNQLISQLTAPTLS